MANILRTTPEDRRKMDREARARSARCDGPCALLVDRTNLTSLKDGRALCPTCFGEFFEAALRKETR